MYAAMSINTELWASSAPASAWVRRFLPLIKRGGRVLDLAAGSGRHTRLLLDSGFAVCAVDRDISALLPLARTGCEVREIDLETDAAWSLGAGCDGIVVTNYLHRPLLPAIAQALADGGDLRPWQRAVRAPAQPRFPAAPRRTARRLCDADGGRLRAGRSFDAAACRHPAHRSGRRSDGSSAGRVGNGPVTGVKFQHVEHR
jgi:SAM-dependent methyltransferase